MATRVGVLVPLSRPGWVEAGRHLLAGLELAAREAGGAIELVVRDTAGDPYRAAAAVDELDRLGVVALAGEYHSVVGPDDATAILVLAGHPEPGASIVASIRRDPRRAGC